MAAKLSEGAIAAIMKGEKVEKPVLQLLNIRPIATANGPPRYRMMMCDGVNTLSCFMLATQLNSMVDDGTLTTNTVCQVNRFILNTLKDGRQVVILMDVTVVKNAGALDPKNSSLAQYTEGSGQGAKLPVASGAAATPAASSGPLKQKESSAGNLSKYNSPAKMPGKPGGSGVVSTPGGSQVKVVPIISLNPYQFKWTICARVTQKGQIRTWSNTRGEGKLFSIELVDESGEIRATAFNEQVDKFFPLIEMNKVYYFSKGNLKTANKQYTAVKNDYEITFTNDTSVVPCEDGQHLPTVQFDFVNILELETVPKDQIVDVIGVCKSYGDPMKVVVKTTGREVAKREIHLVDNTGMMVTVTLWGVDAENFEGSQQPVVAIKGARVSDFGGRSLSVLTSSTLLVNPDRPEAFALRGWFDSGGQEQVACSISNTRGVPVTSGNTYWKTISEAKMEKLGHGEKPDYYSCVGTVVFLRKENCLYKACPSLECHKKVVDEQNGLFRCEKCNQEYPNFKYRLILSVNIADCQDNQWLTCFQEAAESILGKSAACLGELKETNERAFEEVFQNANFSTYEFRIRVKLEMFNDEFRLKSTVLEVKPVNHKEHIKRLFVAIQNATAELL